MFYVFSSGKVAFPEITICPLFSEDTHNWIDLCKKFGMCNRENFENGQLFPSDDWKSNITLSEYFKDITYELSDLISGFEVLTEEKSVVTNKRYATNFYSLNYWYYFIL